jgi:hypothetical protein
MNKVLYLLAALAAISTAVPAVAQDKPATDKPMVHQDMHEHGDMHEHEHGDMHEHEHGDMHEHMHEHHHYHHHHHHHHHHHMMDHTDHM